MRALLYIISILFLVSCSPMKRDFSKNDIERVIHESQEKGDIGPNPLLSINYEIVNYNKGELLNTLKPLDIESIHVMPGKKSIPLFGKEGVDGYIQVLTRRAFD